jgi:hypothetical protein
MCARDRLIKKLETELGAKLNSVMDELFKDLPEQMPMEDSMRCHIVLISALLGMVGGRLSNMPNLPADSHVNFLVQLLNSLLNASKSKLLDLELEKLNRKQAESN